MPRNTKQKQILSDAVSSMNGFFSVDELHARVPSVGIATVYRFVNDLVDSGELYPYVCGGKTIYSIGKKSHCHFVCEETGKVIHFELDTLDFLADKVPGSISSVQLEVRGVCSDCKR